MGLNVKLRWTDSGQIPSWDFRHRKPLLGEVTGHLATRQHLTYSRVFFLFFFLIKHKDHGEGRAPQLYSTFTWTAASCHWWKYENSPVFANSVMTMALGNPGDTRYQLLTLRRVHCYIKMLKLMELEEHSALIPILRWRKLSPRNGNLSHKQLDDKPVCLSRQGFSPSTSNSKRPSAS